MIGLRPRFFTPIFVEEEDFEWCLPYMGVAAILVMLSASCYFIILYLKIYITVEIGSMVSEESKFKFSYVNKLGPRSRYDVDLEYSHTFIYTISCMHLPTFRSQAAIGSEKSTVFTFSYRKT